MLSHMFIGIFDPSIILVFKTCFYWRYLDESFFISNWNHINPSFNEKVVLKIVTIGLGWNSQTTLGCRLLFRLYDIPYHRIFKTYFYWKYLYESTLFWLCNHSNRAWNKEVITKTLSGSLRRPNILDSQASICLCPWI